MIIEQVFRDDLPFESEEAGLRIMTARFAEMAKFAQLRLDVLATNEELITKRILTNPIPDTEELSAGAFREQIEPQCRSAIFELRRKGYRTASSGFGSVEIPGIRYHFSGAQQVVDGGFSDVPNAVAEALENEGYFRRYGGLGFYPVRADLELVTTQWDRLADMMPDTGQPAESNMEDIAAFYEMAHATTPWLDWESPTK